VFPFQHWDVIIQVGFATVYCSLEWNIPIGGVAAPPNQLVKQFGGSPQSISGGFPRAIQDSQGYWEDSSAHPELRGHPCPAVVGRGRKKFSAKRLLGLSNRVSSEQIGVFWSGWKGHACCRTRLRSADLFGGCDSCSFKLGICFHVIGFNPRKFRGSTHVNLNWFQIICHQSLADLSLLLLMCAMRNSSELL